MAKEDLELRMRTRGAGRSKREVDQVANAVDRLGLSGTRAGRSIVATNSKLTKFGKNAQSVGRASMSAGASMTEGLTVPIAAVGAGSVYLALQFEESMTKIRSLVGLSAGEVEHMGNQVLNLAGQTGKAPRELADSLYFLTSSGLDADQAMSALRVSARSAAAGLGDTKTVADAVSSAMNAYGHSNMSAARAADVLTATAKAGKAEPEELAKTIGRVLPFASELGVSFEDVGASIASFSLVGSDAAQATTQLRQILQKMVKPSQQGSKMMEKYGLSVGMIRSSLTEKGLLPTLMMMRKEFKGNTSDLGKFFDGVEGFGGVLQLTGKKADEARRAFNDVRNAAGMTDKAFRSTSQSAGFQLQKALAVLQVAGIRLGNAILPVLVPVLERLSKYIAVASRAFSNLPKGVKTAIIVLGGLLAVIGPVLLVVGAFVAAIGAIASLGVGGLIAGAIIGLIAVIGILAAKFKVVRDVLGFLWKVIKMTPLAWLIRLMVFLIVKVGILGKAFSVLKVVFTVIATIVKGVFMAAWWALRHAINVVWILISNGPLGWLYWGIQRGVKALGGWAAIWSRVKQAIALTWQIMKRSPIGALIRLVARLGKAVWSVRGSISKAFSGMWEGLKSGLVSALNWVLDRLRPLVDAFNLLPGKNITLPDNIGGGAASGAGTGASGSVAGRMARGGLVRRSGVYTVGERGRENVYLPAGAAVEPNGGFGGEVVVPVSLTVDGQVLAKTVHRQAMRKKAVR